MLAEFFGVLMLLLVALAVAGALMAASRRLAPRRAPDAGRATSEAGEASAADESRRFPVGFYLVAMLFVFFELEAVFYMPWAALFRALGGYGVSVMAVFSVPLVIGLVYEWRKGALQW